MEDIDTVSKDYVSLLQVAIQKQIPTGTISNIIKFEVEATTANRFFAVVYIKDQPFSKAFGRNKKEAKQLAAKKLLEEGLKIIDSNTFNILHAAVIFYKTLVCILTG